MSDVLHIGFTGTRAGMSAQQFHGVRAIICEHAPGVMFEAHHGDCVGADAEFDRICSTFNGRGLVVVNPGPLGELSAGCTGVERLPPRSHMKRNAAIVAASHVMIAAPLENEPQPRGGTWATIGMARRALKRGTLRALYVVGREGQFLDYERFGNR